MNTWKSLKQGNLSGRRAGTDEVTRPNQGRSALINSEDIVGKIYFAIVPYLPDCISESKSQKMQSAIYEIVKAEITQALIKIRKDGEK